MAIKKFSQLIQVDTSSIFASLNNFHTNYSFSIAISGIPNQKDSKLIPFL